MPNDLDLSEQLIAAPLPELIKNLGLAVASANAELAKQNSDVVFTIPRAEVEVRMALSMKKETSAGVSAGGNLIGFAVNASYINTFGYSAEGSSTVKIELAAKPRPQAPTGSGTGNT